MKKFLEIYYLDAHPNHYVLSQFGSLSSFSWLWHYLGVTLLLGIGLVVLKKILTHTSWLRVLILVCLYVCSPWLHWLLAEFVQIKFFIQLGVIRFSLFGFWIFLLILFLIVEQFTEGFSRVFDRNVKRFFCMSQSKMLTFFLASFALLISAILAVNARPAELMIKEKNIEFWRFIESTPMDAVFAVPHGFLSLEIPLIGHRAVYFGNGFPFSEKFFEEYQRRLKLTWGSFEQLKSIQGSWIGEKYNNFYHNKSIRDLCRIGADYFIFNNTSDLGQKFIDKNKVYVEPVFKDLEVIIFKKTSLCRG